MYVSYSYVVGFLFLDFKCWLIKVCKMEGFFIFFKFRNINMNVVFFVLFEFLLLFLE